MKTDMAEQTISDTSVELLSLEANRAAELVKAIAEKIGSEDLSEGERRFWLERQEQLAEGIMSIVAVVNVWYEQRQALGLTGEPIQELSETIQ